MARRRRQNFVGDVSRGCRVPGCGRKVAVLGMCWGHYRRELDGKPVNVDLAVRGANRRASAIKYGPGNAPYSVRRRALFEWLLREGGITWEPTTGCHLWTGNVSPGGYGTLGTARDPWGGYAHRAVLCFAGVNLKPGRALHVRHSCDNPACVNIRHLVYGTALENVRDRDEKGRGPAKIGPSTVRAIRAALLVEGVCAVARRFGVSRNIVADVKSRKSWAWVSDHENAGQGAEQGGSDGHHHTDSLDHAA